MLTLKGNELLLYPNNASREGPYRHLTKSAQVQTKTKSSEPFHSPAN